jgi:hypothetical protein
MDRLQKLERALVNADKAGDEAAAKALAKEIIKLRSVQAEPEDTRGIGERVMGGAKALGTGVAQGAIGLASLPQDLGNWAGEKVGYGLNRLMGDTPEQAQAGMDQVQAVRQQAGLVPPSSQDMTQGYENTFGPMYQPQGTAEEYAQTLGQFVPGMLMGPGTLAQRLVSGTSAALGSETAGQASDGEWYEPYARLGGALLGGIAPDVARRAVTPNPIPKSRQSLIGDLDAEGVPLTAGQKTGSTKLRYLESELGGGKAASIMDDQAEKFTGAAARKAGVNATRLTADVMDDAFINVGHQFDDLMAKTKVPLDMQLQDDMLRAVTDYESVVGASAPAANDIMNRVSSLATKNGGVLDGDAYKAIASEIRRKAKSAGSPELREALENLKNALDDAVERGVSGVVRDEWRTARTQYRNLLVLEKAALGAGEKTAEGLISPSQLRNATVQKQGGRNYVRGEGDFAKLARAGEATMKPLPNSGTAGRLNAQNMGAGILSLLGGAAGSAGGPGGALLGGLIGMGTPFAAGRALMSRPVQAYLANQLLQGRGVPAAGKAVIPLLGVAPQIGGPR